MSSLTQLNSAALALALLLLPSLASAQPEYSLQLSTLTVNGTAVDEKQDLAFDWHSTDAVDLRLSFDLNGQFSEAQKLNVFLVLEDQHGQTLFKRSESYWVYPGRHEYDFPDAARLAGFFGNQQFTLRLEASMKGFSPIVRKVPIGYLGPPLPEVLIGAVLLTESDGRPLDVFQPGQKFVVQSTIRVDANDLTAPLGVYIIPQTSCLAGADPTDRVSDTETDEFLLLPGPTGEWAFSAQGTMPDYFINRTRPYCPIRLKVLVVAGQTVIAEATHFGIVEIPERYQNKRGDSEIQLDSSPRWNLHPKG